MVDPSDAMMLLVDQRRRLIQLVRDIELPMLRSNVTDLAKVARLATKSDFYRRLFTQSS